MIFGMVTAFAVVAAPADTLRVQALSAVPAIDGRIADGEYGDASVTLQTATGAVRVRLGHRDGALFVGAEIPDSTLYWGDDLVVALDPDGSAGAAPGAGDRLWIIRRAADSSVAVVAAGDGRWEPPGGARTIGATHYGAGWALATRDGGGRWVVELRIDVPAAASGTPRIAIRTFNDQPGPAWVTWPAPAGVPAQRVERIPDHWAPLVLTGSPRERS